MPSSGSIKVFEQLTHDPAPKRQLDVVVELNKEVGETILSYIAKFHIMQGRAPRFL